MNIGRSDFKIMSTEFKNYKWN